MSYRNNKAEKRDAGRLRIQAAMTTPITDQMRGPDPLQPTHSGAIGKFARVVVLTTAAAAAHLMVLGCFFLVGLGAAGADASMRDEKLKVAIVETQPEPEIEEPKIEEPEIEEPKIEEPKIEEPKVEEPKPKPKPKPKKANDPPPDPTEEPKKEDTSESPKPRRRIVGLNLESTTTGGGGPSFAVGTSRMGKTAARAADPKVASKRPSAKKAPLTTANASSPNKVATRIPVAGVKFQKPTRVGKVKPNYPNLLRKQGVEANVVVLVTISPAGNVKSVKIVQGARYPEFNKAAKTAAKRERFKPATRNGVPTTHTIKYTYRFRLSN